MSGLILVTGAGGQVAHELDISKSEHRIVALPRKKLDITNQEQMNTAIDEYRPDIVINAAAYTQVDRAEEEAEHAYAINRDGVSNLAHACKGAEIPLLHISTDYVFDGNQPGSYREDDVIIPPSVYGASKAEGEAVLRSVLEHHIILRTSWVFSATGNNFVKTMLRLGAERDELGIVNDQHGCPTSAYRIAEVLLKIADRYLRHDEIEWGTYHYCGQPESTWHGFAEQIFQQAPGYEHLKIRGISTSEYPTSAARPLNSVLNCSKLRSKFGIQQSDWVKDLQMVLAKLQN
jgi:dTDP-4-dehydrorhamnose reductase